MSAEFRIKSGDTLPRLREQLLLGSSPIPSFDTATLSARMVRAGTGVELTLTGQAIKVDTALAIAEFAFSTTDTGSSNAGSYDFNWVLNWPGGDKLTIPTTASVRVIIEPLS